MIEKFNASAKPHVRLKVIFFEGHPFLVVDHTDQEIGKRLLMEELGIHDPEFLQTLIVEIAYANLRDKTIDEDAANLMLSVLKGIKPRDEIEAMLALERAAVHKEVMSEQHGIANAKDHHERDSAQRFFINLMKMAVAQTECLSRYRTGAVAQVNVQNVTVSHGGQAVVGNVAQTQHESLPNHASAPPLAVSDAKLEAIPSIGENKKPSAVRTRRRSN